ncbi:MAG: site-2 protease family protein [Francisellaceae bacterium]
MDFFQIFTAFVMFIIPMLFAITLHEAAHGYIAKLRGDNTAYTLGRVTLNPIRHIDPLGTIIVPTAMFLLGTGFLFGWAKPVPVNFANLKKPRLDMVLVAIAGPMSNFIMAIGWFLIMKYVPNFGIDQMAYYGVMLNLMLMVLNLLPIPPLDGSRVITALLTYKAQLQYNRLERWGFLILLLMLFIPVSGSNLLAMILIPAVKFGFSIIAMVF